MTFTDHAVGIAVTEAAIARRFSPINPEIPLQMNREITGQYPRDEFAENPILSAADSAVYAVPLNELLAADSPRLAGEDESHTRRLAEVTTQLPPILVHRHTMRVIDGMHRLRAAMASGKQEIQVRFFDGDEDEAFLHAVRENVVHGLPLTLEDRRAAAQRIIIRNPHLSDRSIGRCTGLSDKTVSTLRDRSSAEGVQTSKRVGMDGRARPLNSFEGRQRAAELMTARPEASLREVAAGAGVSVGTAHDVRKRLQRGEDPVLSRQPGVKPEGSSPDTISGRVVAARRRAKDVTDFDPKSLLESLVQDPAIRQSESGRGVLRWLYGHVVRGADVSQFVEGVPPHRTESVATLAEHCAGVWHQIADRLMAERKADEESGAA
jgi:ParB-like chromosome segregation protein Spo0J